VLGDIPGMKVRMSDMSGMMMSSESGQFEVEISGNLEIDELAALGDAFVAALAAKGGFVDLNQSLRLGRPELRVIPDREKAAALGVDADQLATTVQAMIGGMDVATFSEAGNRYDIRIRLDEKDRRHPDSILGLYVRTRQGGTMELRNLVRVEKGAAPSTITRVNRQRAVKVSANLQDKDLGTALAEAQAIGAQLLPEGVQLKPSGGTEEFVKSFQNLVFAMGIGILVIYMVLAAQFESLVHPLTVMLALPLSMVGAFGGLFVMGAWPLERPGMTLNLFSMIGIILLFGLVTKNSILLVDYANQLRERGLDKVEAMRRAAPVRMRPVLMTAIAMIFGALPAALGILHGAHAARRAGVLPDARRRDPVAASQAAPARSHATRRGAFARDRELIRQIGEAPGPGRDAAPAPSARRRAGRVEASPCASSVGDSPRSWLGAARRSRRDPGTSAASRPGPGVVALA
jgi:HAE1 family hydrophobic/amphiphilic exporter-1